MKKRTLTIKKRLFISNILMLAIPIMLTGLLALIFIFVYMNINGAEGLKALADRSAFNGAIYKAGELGRKWSEETGLAEIREDVEAFNKRDKSNTVLYVYVGDIPLFEDLSIADGALKDSALSQESGTIVIADSGAVYCLQSGAYRLIVIDPGYTVASLTFNGANMNGGIIVAIIAAAAVMVTSRLLARFVYGGIMRPLNVLVKGVREIRDGNLSYRISYSGGDEFAEVCADFNEMARQLSESVERSKKDGESRKELIAGISHDLRTPLTSIKAYVEGIEKGVASTPQARQKYIDTIKAKTSELERIISQLFAFSKLDVGEFPFHPDEVNIVEALKDYVYTVREEYEKRGLSVNLSYGDEKICVNLDIVQFHNILTNILENSVKYKVKERGNMDISYKTEGGDIIIELKDDGAGVPEESLAKLFDVFYRCDRSRNNKNSGSGLGLAISARIMQRFGGGIRAQNAPEGGLIIILTLPALQERGE